MLAEIAIRQRKATLTEENQRIYSLITKLFQVGALAIGGDGLIFHRPSARLADCEDVLAALALAMNGSYGGQLDHLPPEWIELSDKSPN